MENRNDHIPSDSAPEFGGSLKRKRLGKDVSTPIVSQLSFPEDGNEPRAVRLINTGRKLKAPTPIEKLGIEAAEGYQNATTLKKARRQAYAVRRNIEKSNKQQDGR